MSSGRHVTATQPFFLRRALRFLVAFLAAFFLVAFLAAFFFLLTAIYASSFNFLQLQPLRQSDVEHGIGRTKCSTCKIIESRVLKSQQKRERKMHVCTSTTTMSPSPTVFESVARAPRARFNAVEMRCVRGTSRASRDPLRCAANDCISRFSRCATAIRF